MYKIALVCQHGASTGLVMRKMRDASEKKNISSEIEAYSESELEAIVEEVGCILLAPQLSFKLEKFKKDHPAHAGKFTVISPMDFGMMDGEKILADAIALIESLS